jgi:UDP-N-acetylmuramate dehydrogenase
MPAFTRRHQVPLAEKTSFRIGGSAARVLDLECSIASVLSAVTDLRGPNRFLLGGGTNVLVADDGFDGLLVQYEDDAHVDPLGGGRFKVSANTSLDSFVSLVGAEALSGVERLAGIPGSFGGAVVQNAGAYDQEIADVLESVECVNRITGLAETLSLEQCQMSYRDSVFKRSPGRWIIVECTLQLDSDPPQAVASTEIIDEIEKQGEDPQMATAPSISAAVRAVRARKDHLLHPLNLTAGSFFKNPRLPTDDPDIERVLRSFEERRASLIAHGATWIPASVKAIRHRKDGTSELIAGLLISTATDPTEPTSAFSPGRRIGSIRLGAAGPNTLINAGGATAREVIETAREMRRAVLDAYGLRLELEVVLVGDLSVD